MNRLHPGLKKADIISQILCRKKTLQSSHSIEIPRPQKLRRPENYLGKVTSQLGLNDVNYLHTFGIKQTKVYQEVDLLHFHGTHGYFNYLALPALTKDKPAIFTLHDMWPVTGHCVYSYDCERWKTGCGQCPYPKSYPAIKRDNTRLEWRLKNWVYNHSNLTIVTLNNWMTKLAKESLLNRFHIHQIPNGLDTQVYQPLEPKLCRSLLGIPFNKKVIMFAALKLDDHRKGTDLLLKSLQSLPASVKADTVLLLLGNGGETIGDVVDMQTYDLRYVRHDRLKAISYCAADLFVCPTRADNLPLVLQESMACGTPMISFNVGGVSELVRPGITGYLAEPENTEDFRDGIVQLLADKPLRQTMSQNCRTIALEEYPVELQVQQHIKLYRQVLYGVTQTTDDFEFQSAEFFP